MGISAWFRPPRQVFVVFAGVAAVSLVALGGLAWQLLAQDRDLEVERRRVQLESSADTVVAAMQQSLAELQAYLGSADRPGAAVPADVIAVSIVNDRIITTPAAKLLYWPESPQPGRPTAIFEEAERLEFAARDPGAAATSYERLTASADPQVRAGALMRLARVHRKQGAHAEALEVYKRLEVLDATIVAELPASFVAGIGRLSLREEADHRDHARQDATRLLDGLREGRWRLTRSQFSTYFAQAGKWVPDAAPVDAAAITRSDAVADLWASRGVDQPLTRRVVRLPSGVALAIWRATPGRLDAVIAGPAYLASLGRGLPNSSIGWAMSDAEGQPLLGAAPNTGTTSTRAAATSGLPWSLHVFSTGDRAPIASPRRQLVWLILGLVTFILGAGWYFIFRSLSRERHVARLQSDFVAAVSHEFRSPLTALTHAADLLVNDRLTSDSQRRQTHQVLVRDTARLRGLVEGLLAFGRLEAGAPFHFEDADLGAVIEATVSEFQEEVSAQGYVIALTGADRAIRASIDREAVTRALRNLLDNAVKYSPDSRRIQVEVSYESGMVAVAVRDHGLGIPAAEQDAIFERFVRGRESTSRRIRGTGIGLAMVRQIASAHGGDITLSSVPGEGSVFTLRLPTAERMQDAAQPAERAEVTQ